MSDDREEVGVGAEEEDDELSPERPQKITGRASTVEIKRAAALTLAENGFGYGAIGKAIERHPKHLAAILPKLKRESLASAQKVKLASKVVEKVLGGFAGVAKRDAKGNLVRDADGKPIIEFDTRVKGSTAMRAAELVYSRAEPKQEEGGQGGQAPTFIQVNQQFFGAAAPVIEGEKLHKE